MYIYIFVHILDVTQDYYNALFILAMLFNKKHLKTPSHTSKKNKINKNFLLYIITQWTEAFYTDIKRLKTQQIFFHPALGHLQKIKKKTNLKLLDKMHIVPKLILYLSTKRQNLCLCAHAPNSQST